ncbi:S41 family peptidase [Winogradskyella flava]|uniref:S41 family peptidase n=1 Tax=Winogradskyella flava TaxID=1884876 RepID=UPI0024902BE9|nr:S41 family peptidase [Winogradskyella flava]
MKFKLILLLAFLSTNLFFAQKEIQFEITDIPQSKSKYIGLRGDTYPLSWDKTLFLEKKGEFYCKSIKFKNDVTKIEYKYVLDDGTNVEWESIQNRHEFITNEKQSFKSKWNVEKSIDVSALPKLTVKQLMEDYTVISNTIRKVHPGLYRYNDSTSIKQNLEILKRSFQRPLTYAETFLAMSKFISTIQCDHTSVSFYNQEATTNSLIHFQSDKVPFTFKWLQNKMIITNNASESNLLEKGTEVISINNIPVSKILATLLPYISADGATKQNKISKAEVDGYSFRFSAFDVLYPLLFPIKENQLTLEIISPDNHKAIQVKVATTARTERSESLSKRYSHFPESPEDLWEYKILENNIGYLKIGSFATNNFKKDWKLMLENAFNDLKKNKVEDLILDIRENQGGRDDTSYELEKYIYKNDVVTDGLQSQSRFLEFPDDVKPHITTWDYWFYNLKDDTHFKNGIYYVFPKNLEIKTIKQSRTTFQGNIYLLTSAKNVSGAFYLARLFKKGKSGTLIGQETGGNQNGINGGAILFFKPPNSRININLPVMGTFSTEAFPNKGIEPDIQVVNTVSDIVNNSDTTLNKAIEIINKS